MSDLTMSGLTVLGEGIDVRVLLLDADGVVQQNPPGWLDRLRAVVPDGEAFTDELFAAERPAMTGQRCFPEVLAEVAGRWQVADRVEELLGHWRAIEPAAETLELARRARRNGLDCYLASNQHAYRAAFMREALGYDAVFTGQFYSCDLGALKSSPEFFERVLARLGVPPGQVVFVDDSEEYVDQARAVGLRAVRWSVDDGIPRLRQLLTEHGLPL